MSKITKVDVEFYEAYDVPVDDVCKIMLFRRVSKESYQEPKASIENIEEDEDLFLSWLASIASSRGVPLARVIVKANGFTFEAIYTSIRPKYTIPIPYISRIKRICLVRDLKPSGPETKDTANENQLDGSDNEKLNLASIDVVYDFSNEDVYVFNSPITPVDTSKVVAIVIETENGIAFLKLDEITQTVKTAEKSSRKRKRKSKSRKKRRRKKSRSKVKSS